jgi:DNA uptake protein ComE-like DNA-binding protein
VRGFSKFHLSVTERKGFIVLLIFLFGVIAFRIAMIFWPSQQSVGQSTLMQEMEVWREQQRIALLVPQAFDPNTVADSIIQQFKISAYAKENWQKFRNRGNIFKTKDDVLAIYAMDTNWFTINYDSILVSPTSRSPAAIAEFQKFPFDPNQASQAELERLGIPKYLAERILKYRLAGGKFKQPEDLNSIYGFPEALFLELKPYIRITQQPEGGTTKEVKKETKIEIVNLNSCDSLQLLNLPGIGPTFANRILMYRKKLGGFYSANQLLEVYGFDQARLNSVAQYIIIGEGDIQKLKINSATFKELLAHPYLNYEQVKVLVNYRDKVGPFKNLNGLSQLEHFTPKDAERLIPYLSVE